MKTSSFTVDDIHCGGCERMIKTLVGGVAGVRQVDPNHRTNQVVVTYDESEVDDNAVREALANSGFRPT